MKVNPHNQGRFSVVIPAAGNSDRMGQDKVLLKRKDGRTFAGYLIDSYLQAGAGQVVIVVNDKSLYEFPENDRVKIVVNHFTERGRSYSICLGMNSLAPDLPCFIQNVDNQFISKEIISDLLNGVEDDVYCVPVFNRKSGHPVLIGSEIVKQFRNGEGTADFKQVLSSYKRIEIAARDERILLNVNTLEQYQRFIGME
ncbi:MAG TPA: NTP transferase domain-containing protein [Bacteroidales bacterium]|nr:NTP transferase domain-containing protein [Bacteroidales bacterium]